MAETAENIAAMPATSQKGSVVAMSRDVLMREAQYQAAMQMFRSLLAKGVLTKEDYATAEKMMTEKYHPNVGTLFSDIELT